MNGRIASLVTTVSAVALVASCTGATMRAERIPFEACAEFPQWERPSDLEQRDRLASIGRELLPDHPAWGNDFIVVYGSAGIDHDLYHRAGLWTEKDGIGGFVLGSIQEDILKGTRAEVWAFMHDVVTVRREGDHYLFTITPVEQGAYFILEEREPPGIPLTSSFVDENSRMIASFAEDDLAWWPWN